MQLTPEDRKRELVLFKLEKLREIPGVALLEEFLSMWTEHWMIVLGPILILVVLYARGGVWGLVDRRESARE